jgi:Mlc titration factor MtfA (ptsG expression regulator)
VEVRQAGFEPYDQHGQGGNPYHEQRLRYEYQDAAGSTFTGEAVTRSSKMLPSYHQGQAVNIQYRKDAPGVSRIAPVGVWSNWKVALAVLVLMGGIFAVAVWLRGEASLAQLVSRVATLRVLPGFKSRRRKKLLSSPFPYGWRSFLRKNVGVYGLLTPAEQEKLQADLRIIVAEKRWEGCGRLVVNDEIKVTIAAQACVLLLGLEHDYFSQVRSILVYPSAFKNPEGTLGPDGVVHQDPGMLGQAWYRGPVILAWDEVLAGRDPAGGQNVVYHEFAHQLDFRGEWGNRKTLQADRSRQRRWQEVMKAEYEQLVRDSEAGKATLLDQYGATKPAEFFAVATECFFGQPEEMQSRHPALYDVMRDFYGQDPAARLARRCGLAGKPPEGGTTNAATAE